MARPFAPGERIPPDLLLKAYASGVFPMAESADDPEVFWVRPETRGIIPLDGLHIPRSLGKAVRQGRFDISFDRDFAAVIDGCAEPDEGRETTWINNTIRSVYGELFRRDIVHTVEVWDGSALVGGLYGVSIGAAFFGESMFHRKTDCSKIAMAHLIDRLKAGGYRLLDTQFVTDHLRTFGGIEIPREDYELRLADALAHEADWSAIDNR